VAYTFLDEMKIIDLGWLQRSVLQWLCMGCSTSFLATAEFFFVRSLCHSVSVRGFC